MQNPPQPPTFLPLSQGYFARIDPEDLPRLRKFKWHIHRHRKSDSLYASRYYHPPGSPRTNRKLEYEVLNLPQPLPRGRCIDHINRNPLDCRKQNLRLATIQQNNLNKPAYRHKKTSIYKGVFYDKQRNRWSASLQSRNKMYHLGRFKYERLAMHIYNLAALRHHGRFAYLNQWLGPSPGHPDPHTQKIYAWLKSKIPNFNPPAPHPPIAPPKPPAIQLLLPFD